MITVGTEKFTVNIDEEDLYKFNITEILLFLTKINLSKSQYNRFRFYYYQGSLIIVFIYENMKGKLIIDIDII